MEGEPNLYSLERTEKDHKERRLDRFPEELKDKNDDLKRAREALLNKKELYIKFLQAIKDRESRDSSGFAEIENLFIKYCQNLPDKEIEAIVRQFNTGLNAYVPKNNENLSNSQRLPENLHERSIKSRGIISVIEFIKARKELLGAKPQTTYSYYLENVLDSKFKIDLVESIYEEKDGELIINTMNLIQVKSSEPSEREKNEITNSHSSWVNYNLMDFESFRKEYTEGIPEKVTIESLARNSEEVQEILMDIVTNPDGFSVDDFLLRLDLENFDIKQKAWLVSENGESLKILILKNRDNGIVTAEYAADIIKAIDELDARLRVKAKLPKNIARIKNIRSIIAVGSKIIEEKVLKTQSENSDHDKIMKYN